MTTLLAALLLLTGVVTVAYWVDFFVRGSVNVVEEEWYIRFERSFPVADGFMSICAALAAVGLLAGADYGVGFALVAAGALIFLGLMDVTLNVDNGLYRLLRTSGPMRAELVINLWCLGLGATLLVTMLPEV
ncbi:hypothetical protein EKO23_09900 [Nocardioides guangzhouensis]|uniref:Uncharacterized protein n=1 Tax=Nocardioides guangzhouensis TaxID=2497878 RepID=A0A4Q4ZFR4_9ACTN|nr:hypothetical protein [Nocardioides guangzhouensis]RYP86256.1 hypothetical protein EKO23_09900 [Nocardioides guangzhouensis]